MNAAIITARAGSKSIINKNVYVVAGKPMVAYPLQAALDAELIGRVYTSTDGAEIAEATRALVARTFIEPGLDEYELAHRYQAVAEQLMPLAGPWLEHVFALHLQQVLRSDALTQ